MQTRRRWYVDVGGRSQAEFHANLARQDYASAQHGYTRLGIGPPRQDGDVATFNVTYEEVPKAGSGNAGRVIAILAGIALIVVVVANSQGIRTGGTRPPAAAQWWPGGYTLSSDADVAYRWLSAAEYECSSLADGCWGIEAVTQGCPSSLYVELSISDSKGTAIGYTNDVAGAVLAGQHAKLEFASYDKGASTARVSDVSCY